MAQQVLRPRLKNQSRQELQLKHLPRQRQHQEPQQQLQRLEPNMPSLLIGLRGDLYRLLKTRAIVDAAMQ